MAEYNFLQRKKDVLNKKDKSHAGKWDKKIIPLCKKINKTENYYTTSSCSGRVLLMIDQQKKGAGLFLRVEHKKISLKSLKKALEDFSGNQLIKFKSEPPIIHVVCKTLEDANSLLEKGFESGWKKSGIINLKRNIIVELHGTEKLEFPIFKEGKFLVNDNFLKLIVKKSNHKLKIGWNRINFLDKLI